MSEAKRKPAAFMSYSHADTEVGRLTGFRKRLSQEVEKQTGEKFPIFQDEDSVQWGNNWQERIEESLDEVTFFIPIITPGFFKSAHCRDELEQFLDREREVGHRDLVLPVYYADYSLLNDRSRRSNDALVYVIATRQYADWRDLRDEPATSPRATEATTRLASAIREALEHVQDREPVPPRPSAKPKAPTRIVDSYGTDGAYTTIGEAIKGANPRDRILVRPGFYQEGLVVDKPLEIIGDGDATEIEVQTTGGSAILFKAPFGRVANLTLTALPKSGAKREVHGVDIAEGRLELEGCDISSRGGACVNIRGDANPRLRRNRIHDGLHHGVNTADNTHATLEDNDIFDNNLHGVFGGGDNSNLTLRRNTIHDNRIDGVSIFRGYLTLEDSDIIENGSDGIGVDVRGTAKLRRNRINRNGGHGIWVSETGIATIHDNDLRDNSEVGLDWEMTWGGHGAEVDARRNAK